MARRLQLPHVKNSVDRVNIVSKTYDRSAERIEIGIVVDPFIIKEAEDKKIVNVANIQSLIDEKSKSALPINIQEVREKMALVNEKRPSKKNPYYSVEQLKQICKNLRLSTNRADKAGLVAIIRDAVNTFFVDK